MLGFPKPNPRSVPIRIPYWEDVRSFEIVPEDLRDVFLREYVIGPK